MKPPIVGINVLRPLLLGILLGGVATHGWLTEKYKQRAVEQPVPQQKSWPPREFLSPSDWIYLRVDESGWSTGLVGSFQDLDERLGRLTASDEEIVLPIFPTVYTPKMVDKIYYDAILESGIKHGDKVLVVGAGSGADAWVASLKSKTPVYVVEINPMAIANARAVARLANFQIKPVLGDIREVELPDDFKDFDFVLWNMPFLWKEGEIAGNSFHDGDDGSILKHLLAMLPSLLKKGGKAVVLNNHLAAKIITAPGVTTNSNHDCTLYVIPNP